MQNKENFNEYQKPKILESLESHNSKKIGAYSTQKANGIACPNCGKELYDTNSNIMLATHPAKFSINCHNCDYIGTRF